MVARRSDLASVSYFTGTTTVAPALGSGCSANIHSTRLLASIFPFGWITYAFLDSPEADAPPAART